MIESPRVLVRSGLFSFAIVIAIALATACSSSSTTTSGGPPGDAGATTPQKQPPASAADAPVLEDFESGTPQTVPAGNTPFPHGVHCDPTSDTALDIVYACSVYVSKTQTATLSGGYTCGALDVKLDVSPVPTSQALQSIAAPKPGTNFGLSIPKQIFPTLIDVSLTASCSTTGGGIQVNRPYRLLPLP